MTMHCVRVGYLKADSFAYQQLKTQIKSKLRNLAAWNFRFKEYIHTPK